MGQPRPIMGCTWVRTTCLRSDTHRAPGRHRKRHHNSGRLVRCCSRRTPPGGITRSTLGVRDPWILAYASPHWADPGQWHADLRAFTARAGSEMLGFAAGARDPRPSDVDSTAAEWALARDLGLPIHTHAGVDPDTLEGVIAGLAALLGPDVTLIQCSHLGDADFDAIAAAKASVSISPSSGMTGGLGRPPIQKVIDRGIRPGLGVGSEQSAPGDMFAQMRALISGTARQLLRPQAGRQSRATQSAQHSRGASLRHRRRGEGRRSRR